MATFTRKRYSRKNWSQIIRRTVQVAFVVFILTASIRHGLLEETVTVPSTDALCPLGGLETLWRVVVEREYVPKTHPSNIILGLGLLAGVLLGGAAFCGWICPFGTLQDGLTWLRTKLRLPELRVPAQLDRWLRYGRFIVLALMLYMTISTVNLWFANYDPYRTLFGLGWLFEFNIETQWPAYLITASVLVLSFFIPRFWCKYTCPLGGALSLLGHLSLLRIRRNQEQCKNCALCEAPCPVGIAVASANPTINTNCIGCLACVETCPRQGALEIQLAPSWFTKLGSLANHLRRPATSKGDAS